MNKGDKVKIKHIAGSISKRWDGMEAIILRRSVNRNHWLIRCENGDEIIVENKEFEKIQQKKAKNAKQQD